MKEGEGEYSTTGREKSIIPQWRCCARFHILPRFSADGQESKAENLEWRSNVGHEHKENRYIYEK